MVTGENPEGLGRKLWRRLSGLPQPLSASTPSGPQQSRPERRIPEGSATQGTGLTASDVERARFRATKFREGYDQDEVDDYLDRVVQTLRGEASDAVALRAEDVARARFTLTKLREGYDQQAVDSFLADVAAELRRRERGIRR
jgi:DivIVA domain-containing protein